MSYTFQGGRPTFAKDQDQEPPKLQGHIVDSLPEYYFGKALEKFGWDYGYQWRHYYGTLFPDGAIVDFVVFTVPLDTPVFIDGEYFHTGSRRERDKIQREGLFAIMGGRMAHYIAILASEVDTPELAEEAVKKYIGAR